MGTPPRRDGQGGHEVDVIDLYADGFDPRMGTAEHEAYETDDSIVDPLARHYANLVETCEAMVFVYPTWWGGVPPRPPHPTRRTRPHRRPPPRLHHHHRTLPAPLLARHRSRPPPHPPQPANEHRHPGPIHLACSPRHRELQRVRPGRVPGTRALAPRGPLMAQVLVVHAHPVPTSFNAALCDVVVSALTRSGHSVDLLDLYADEFDPVLGAEEWRDRPPTNTAPGLVGHIRRLRAAEMLVFVYPTWWSEQPAMLKGWFDRVWTEGVAFHRPDEPKRVERGLSQIRTLTVVTTHGSPRWMNYLQGQGGRIRVSRGLRLLCHSRTRFRWIAMYSMDRATDSDRTQFLEEVEKRIGKL
ncbi:MAG: hypothetical protein GY698_22830 [Actinomycetia bacterium]|nr:hypothetical protein [Actinomycetes bacterium]